MPMHWYMLLYEIISYDLILSGILDFKSMTSNSQDSPIQTHSSTFKHGKTSYTANKPYSYKSQNHINYSACHISLQLCSYRFQQPT